MRAKSADEVRKWRMIALSPIFTAIEAQREHKNALADKLGISKQLLNHYRRGAIRVPSGFIDQCIKELDLPHDAIPPEARELVERKAQTTKGA